MDIQWVFHLAYNPTAAGNTERQNGLLKTNLLQLKDSPLEKATETVFYELNTRQRLNRASPLEDISKSDLKIEQQSDIS